LENRILRWRNFFKPTIIAAFSHRYDSHLVPGLIENIKPYVDGWVSFDDRNSTDLFSSEPKRRNELINAAISLGAKWIFAVDPDERLESGAVGQFRKLTLGIKGSAWTFDLRELYEPEVYRIDGVWGRKRIPRLFPARPLDANAVSDLHAHWFPPKSLQIKNSGINLYHLKMIAPSRRKARRDLYKHLDPQNKYQAIGYDYLADEAGAQFQSIPSGRGYLPPHQEDGKLWMPEIAATAN
jgi:hypothetical protein